MTLARTIAFGLAATLLAGAALAQPPAGAGGVRQACAADFQKSCPDAKPGDGSYRQCARDHFRDFSQPCQGALQAMRQRMMAARAAQTPATNSP